MSMIFPIFPMKELGKAITTSSMLSPSSNWAKLIDLAKMHALEPRRWLIGHESLDLVAQADIGRNGSEKIPGHFAIADNHDMDEIAAIFLQPLE